MAAAGLAQRAHHARHHQHVPRRVRHRERPEALLLGCVAHTIISVPVLALLLLWRLLSTCRWLILLRPSYYHTIGPAASSHRIMMQSCTAIMVKRSVHWVHWWTHLFCTCRWSFVLRAGNGYVGQLGNGQNPSQVVYAPLLVDFGRDYIARAVVGHWETWCALLDAGTVRCLGGCVHARTAQHSPAGSHAGSTTSLYPPPHAGPLRLQTQALCRCCPCGFVVAHAHASYSAVLAAGLAPWHAHWLVTHGPQHAVVFPRLHV